MELSLPDLRAETMMMGLRLNTGVSYAHFKDRCGIDLLDLYGTEVARLEAEGLVVQDAVGVRLTPTGRALGNQVFMRFLD